ncbi:ABC transporter ATP-binding protein [Arthrobacter castelli]|uniref:ABC transporter ATP-binding protein n=1 Tax=Arthrobacter castelli TaxID=271431 RepID=UPI0003F59528|nr:ABC transporter ATP-binding protein [Arthrobacter castelli]
MAKHLKEQSQPYDGGPQRGVRGPDADGQRSQPDRVQQPGPAAVAARDLTVRRSGNTVLDGLDFTVGTGAITGLLGPSGSGKTTLMRAMVGVQRISGGTIEVLGRPAGSPSLRSRVGYVAQTSSVYPDITVEDNVRYFAALFPVPRSAAAEAIDAVGLSPYAKRRAADLSGGQFSRVSLACALVSQPDLLILDEPTVGLDPVLRVELWDRFARMAEAGTTLIISSHVMEEASHCQSLLLLREGRLLSALSPADLQRRGGSEDLERAFLALIRDAETREAA